MEHVRLAPHHAAFGAEHVARGTHVSPDTCVAALIEAAARAESDARPEAPLLEGLEGEGIPWSPDDVRRLARLANDGA